MDETMVMEENKRVKDAKTAVVLCGTVPHTMLLRKLKQRGYHTILLDWNPNAPAIPFADEFVQESAFDKDAVMRVAMERAADLVISSCSEQANSVCCYVGEKLGLPHPYSYETSLDVTDKGRMKTLFAKGGVTTSDFMVYHNAEELAKCTLPFPVVVKPVDAYSSKGVRKAENAAEMLEYGQAALSFSRAGRGIVEGYCPGIEIQVDCVAIDGQARVLMTRSKNTMSQDAMELNSCGSTVPAAITDAENAQAAELAQRICDSFGLVNTPFFYQARLDNGIISVLEFAPRIGGGLSFQMVKRATGIDIVDLSIASFLGEKVLLDGKFPQTRHLATLLLYMQPGIFDHVEGLDEVLADGTVDYAAVLKKKGALVSADRSSSNRAVTLLLTANSREELEEKTKMVLKRIDIVDVDGVCRMVR